MTTEAAWHEEQRAVRIIKLEAENYQLKQRIAELAVDRGQFHVLNDENDALGIENEELKRRVAELEAQIATFTAAGQILERHIKDISGPLCRE